MKYFIKIVLISFMYFLIFSCDSDYKGTATEPDDQDTTSTQDSISYVLDVDGNPVTGAKIVYTLDVNVYETDTGYAIVDHLPEFTPMDFKDSIEINYTVEFSENITIWVENDQNDTIVFLVNKYLGPGVHKYYWDKKDTNGKYINNSVYQLWGYGGNTVNSPYYMNKYLIYNYENAFENEIHYLATTNSAGKFDLDSIKIPQYCEHTYDSLCWGYRRFSEYVKLWAVKDGIENIYLDSVRLGYDSSVILKP